MSDKPSPKSISSSFMNAALAVFVGSIALYLAIQLLRSIAVPLVMLGCMVIVIVAISVWRKRIGGASDDW
jgi:hypothetical protein